MTSESGDEAAKSNECRTSTLMYRYISDTKSMVAKAYARRVMMPPDARLDRMPSIGFANASNPLDDDSMVIFYYID